MVITTMAGLIADFRSSPADLSDETPNGAAPPTSHMLSLSLSLSSSFLVAR